MKIIPAYCKKEKKYYYIKVDDEDYNWLNQWNWKINVYNNVYIPYKAFGIGNTTPIIIVMYRAIMNCPKNMVVDHINHDRLDNRKSNLRICKQSENARNHISTKGSSKYKGVCWHKIYKKWLANLKYNYKQIFLGHFTTEKEAAMAYNKKAKELFGEYAYLNDV